MNHARPDLDPSLIRVAVTDDVEAGLRKLDDTFLL